MIPFSRTFAEVTPVKFLSGAFEVSAGGGVDFSAADEADGVEVSASITPKTVSAIGPDGVLRSAVLYVVNLLDDPAPLAGGLGVRQYDAFRWEGHLIQCQGPAVREGTAWRVECVRAE